METRPGYISLYIRCNIDPGYCTEANGDMRTGYLLVDPVMVSQATVAGGDVRPGYLLVILV
jgi:hypothetical protein